MKRWLIASVLFCPSGWAAAEEKVVVQYNCIPGYANWGAVTSAYERAAGVRVAPDLKGSGAAISALVKERKRGAQADCAYYSGPFVQAAVARHLHISYKPRGWERIPENLKHPGGLWWTVHSHRIAFLINTSALGDKPIPRSFADLLSSEYEGLVAYDDPTWSSASLTFVLGLNELLGGEEDLKAGFHYLKKLHPNIHSYPTESLHESLLNDEIAIYIAAESIGLRAKHADGAPVEVVIPREGTILLPQVMALVKGAPHEAEAKRYFDWLLSDEAQRVMAEGFVRPVIDVELPEEIAGRFAATDVDERVVVVPLKMVAEAGKVKQRWQREVRLNR